MARPSSKPRIKDIASNSPEARGERIRRLREFLGHSRVEFGEKYDIPPTSLQNWETARYSGLPETNANKLVHGFREEGLDVTLEWLMLGEGIDPLEKGSITSSVASVSTDTEETIIAQELRIFHQLNKDAVDLIVADETMLPCFKPGDWTAGKRFFDKEIDLAIGHVCIIHTLDGQVLLRMVQKGDDKGTYTLICTNPLSKLPKSHLNIKLFSAAPVLWMRRKSIQKP